MVIKDLEARMELGRERYGTVLRTLNGRDALLDAYQEALDLCIYLRQELAEQDCECPVEDEEFFGYRDVFRCRSCRGVHLYKEDLR